MIAAPQHFKGRHAAAQQFIWSNSLGQMAPKLGFVHLKLIPAIFGVAYFRQMGSEPTCGSAALIFPPRRRICTHGPLPPLPIDLTPQFSFLRASIAQSLSIFNGRMAALRDNSNIRKAAFQSA